ncbi:MAG: glycosyltransferase [Actinomycetales bacterium]|nr:glycosyltransferase [Actinomycetales bacterium]
MGMRVTIVTESFLPSLNGVTNSVLRVLDTLAAEGHDAIVIAPTAPSGRHNGFRVIRTPAVPFMQFPVGIPTVAIYQTDIAGYLQRYGMQFARPLVDKMVAAIHSPTTLNLTPTPESAAYLLKLGVPRVAIWERGVDLDLFHPQRRTARVRACANAASTNAPEPLTIGFVGRLAPEKQVHKMKTLFGLPNTRFVVVGDGPERRRLEADFAGHPVKFTGALCGTELADAYTGLDVFVHFGTEETFGQTIQEAQATGLPVVAPASGGPRFLIEHGTSGFLADPDEPASFVNYVQRLTEDATLRARMGESARRSVSNKSWAANNALLLKHLSHTCRYVSAGITANTSPDASPDSSPAHELV